MFLWLLCTNLIRLCSSAKRWPLQFAPICIDSGMSKFISMSQAAMIAIDYWLCLLLFPSMLVESERNTKLIEKSSTLMSDSLKVLPSLFQVALDRRHPIKVCPIWPAYPTSTRPESIETWKFDTSEMKFMWVSSVLWLNFDKLGQVEIAFNQLRRKCDNR